MATFGSPRLGKGLAVNVSRVSIIIPFFCDTPSEAFEETLASVLAHRPTESEILIADSAGYADPWGVGDEGVTFLTFPEHTPLLETLNAAIRSATAPIIHILYAGTNVSENWTQSPLEHFEDSRTGIVIPAVFDRRKSKRIFAQGIVFSRGGSLRTVRRSQFPQIHHETVAPHVSSVFFRKAALQQIGLLETSFIPQLAYVDATFLLKERGWVSVVDTQSRLFVRPNMLPATSPFQWAKQLERLYFRWMGRQTSFWSIGAHLGAVVADFWRHFPRMRAYQSLGGRLIGLVSPNKRNDLDRKLQATADESALRKPLIKPREAA